MTNTRSPRGNPKNVSIGDQFGRWTVTGSFIRQGANNSAFFPSRCICGTEKLVVFRTLQEIEKGKYPNASCGCYHKEVMSKKRMHGSEPFSKEWERSRKLWTAYRMTIVDFDKLLLEQNGLCAICLEQMHVPYVDHCHSTGAVRGLLCHHCNTVLGMAKDNPTILINAAKYLGAIVTD